MANYVIGREMGAMYSAMHDRLIPITLLDGGEAMCGICEIFKRAHDIQDVKVYSNLARCALLRLLMAFLMDSHGLDSRNDRADLLETGRFDGPLFDQYVMQCERNGPAFELFDPFRPFMQCTYQKELDERAEKPVAALIPEYSSGNNHIFFQHAWEYEHAITPSQALQGMLVTYLYCTAGAQGFPSGVNNTPPIYTFIEGKNLFQTLVINSLSRQECENQNIPYGLGEVPWRNGETVIPKKIFQNISLLQALTWRPRRITLKFNQKTSLVDKVLLQAGHNFMGNELWRDLNVPRFKKKDGSYSNLKPELGHALWQATGTLVSLDRNTVPVAVADSLDILSRSWQGRIGLSLTGIITNQALILGTTCERLSIPIKLLNDATYARRFSADLAFFEDTQRILVRAISTNYPLDIARQAQEILIQYVYKFLFGAYLQEIEDIELNGDLDERLFSLLKHLDEVVLAGLLAALDQVVELTGSDAKSLIRHASIKRIIVGWYYNRRKEREEA
jgi:CRISPR system Cascade subunit CasA